MPTGDWQSNDHRSLQVCWIKDFWSWWLFWRILADVIREAVWSVGAWLQVCQCQWRKTRWTIPLPQAFFPMASPSSRWDLPQIQMSFNLIPEGGETAVELLPGDFEPSRRANHPHSAPAQATCPSWVIVGGDDGKVENRYSIYLIYWG